ncbi:MAG TPA: aminodeoxychorismate synthase component I [Flavobacteriales bacterium]|jgi:para-aminobenzoate synthetase component I|nr:anthranilate synthase component I family protein [Flavobacteriales bacterium]HAW18882.1 aminodeoxychorismate synthase component I [Flavobacteriales bacterium]
MERVWKQFEADLNFQDKLSYWATSETYGFCFRGKGWGSEFNHALSVFAGSGIAAEFKGSLTEAGQFIEEHSDYIISHLNYDLKNQLEDLNSAHDDRVGFPEFTMVVPQWVIRVSGRHVEIGGSPTNEDGQLASDIFEKINRVDLSKFEKTIVDNVKKRVSKQQYLDNLERIAHHLQRGDIYQANICQEFYWDHASLNPAQVFNDGFAANPNPFCALFRHGDQFLMSWSPERFLSFSGSNVLSQPMKGTARRSSEPLLDMQYLEELETSEKDRRENVMIVDMVRNDLSHFAVKGSVQVPELYEIRTYPQIHQMHSTVKAELKPGTNLFDALLKAFPMGSMTGTPKIRAMQLIEEVESTKRGLYSGTFGFITPEKNADFSVIIRSLLYNAKSEYLSLQVGGGITAMSDPELEYDECLAKAEPILYLMQDSKTAESNFA